MGRGERERNNKHHEKDNMRRPTASLQNNIVKFLIMMIYNDEISDLKWKQPLLSWNETYWAYILWAQYFQVVGPRVDKTEIPVMTKSERY